MNVIEKIDHVRSLRGLTTEELEVAARLTRNYLSNRFSRGTDPIGAVARKTLRSVHARQFVAYTHVHRVGSSGISRFSKKSWHNRRPR